LLLYLKELELKRSEILEEEQRMLFSFKKVQKPKLDIGETKEENEYLLSLYEENSESDSDQQHIDNQITDLKELKF
jgi:hypothetical protein